MTDGFATVPPDPRHREQGPPGGPRWLLAGDAGFGGTYEDDVPLGSCAEIDGLFVDLPPRPRERFTLLGCTPAGPLADALARLGTGTSAVSRVWLGDVAVTAPEPPPGTPPSWAGEDLGDVAVLARRPSVVVPGTVDVDLSGFVQVYDRTDAVHRPRAVTDFVLLDRAGASSGTCRDVTGVFRAQAAAPVPRVRLIGCRPEPPLLAAVDAIGQPTRAGARRRRVRAEVYAAVAHGPALPVHGAVVSGTVRAGEASRLGAGLLDITVDSDPREPLPTGALDMLRLWGTGRPAERNLWAGFDRDLRAQWAGMAAGLRQHRAPDRPPGTAYHLDGRFVTDVEGFYCAIGEAVDGPGGYFGADLDGLADCLHGGSGAWPPWHLVWHDAAVAREHLVDGYDHRRLGPAVSLDRLVDLLTAHAADVDLR